jgi:elongation factor Ts
LAINTEMIKTLREATNAGVLDCKKALEANDGDLDKATAYLREKGLAVAAKKASREANEGLVALVVSGDARQGAMIEVNCETDFVARTPDFQTFVESLLDQVAQSTDVPDVPALLEQPFIKDKNVTVQEHLTQLIAKLGENVVVRRFARMQRDGNGLIEGYVHPGGRIGVLVSVSAESDDVVGGDGFYELVHDLALQIAAIRPEYLSVEDIPESALEVERARYQAQASEENKPDHIKERIVAGKLEKWYEQVCLLRQPFIKDDSLTIGDLVKQKAKDLGAPLSIERFVRYEIVSGE